jgi:hypothetical protein
MKIYVAHSTQGNYHEDLYIPLKTSSMSTDHTFILPHENSATQYNSKELFKKHECSLVIAEVSYPTTGEGIELGWADIYQIPIICIYKEGTRPSGALKVISNTFLQYSDSNDMIAQLKSYIEKTRI